jgi:hypothetical protein
MFVRKSTVSWYADLVVFSLMLRGICEQCTNCSRVFSGAELRANTTPGIQEDEPGEVGAESGEPGGVSIVAARRGVLRW